MDLLALISPWQAWLLAALLILLLDLILFGGLLASGGGIMLVLAGGALGGLIPAALGIGLAGQVLGAVVGMVVMTVLVFWMGWSWTGKRERNRPADPRIAGRTYRVEQQNGRLGVRVLGDFFPLAGASDHPEPREGDEVVLIEFQGISAVVRPASDGRPTP